MGQRKKRGERRVLFLNRLVFSYTLVFSIILLVIMTVLYVILSANNRSEATLNHQMLVNQPLKQLERFLTEMDSVAYKGMINEILIRKFSDLREEADPENHYDFDILDNIDTGSILTGINGRYMPVWRITAYNNYGDFIYSGALVDREVVKWRLGQMDVDSLMDYFRDSEPDYILLPPDQDRWSNYFKSSYITIIRPIMNVYSRDVVGLMEVQQNRSKLEEYLQFAPDRSYAVNIYDPLGQSVLIQGTDLDHVVAAETSDEYGWTVELLEPLSVTKQEQIRLIQLLVTAWLVLTVILYLVISLITGRVAKPLMDLTRAVKKINVADPRQIEIVDTKIDEVVALQTAFNNMLESLTFSMEQEKKSFLLAMQAQMNPHFLYNVLSVINAVALEKRSETVVRICGNLSSMLRYSSSYATGSATVKEELDHTVAYLELMKARYDYMFRYDVDVDPELESVIIPKLSIQPLCENSFIHAFSHMEPPYELAIRVKTEADGWSIRVTDNGPGFAEDVRQRALERANLASYEDLSKMQMGGLGLVSSVVRLKLMTQKKIVCDIQPVEPHGASVIINLSDELAIEDN